MTSLQQMLTVCVLLLPVLGIGALAATTESVKYTCRTFGSGVVQPFNGSSYYVRSTCPFTLTRFTHNRVECDINVRRGDSGLLVQVEIIINKVKTVLQNGSVLVDKTSVSLPYDHTYQHMFHYGIYTKLRSSLLPLSVTWHNVPGGIDTLWVDLEQELSTDMSGLCGKYNVSDSKQQLIASSVFSDNTCQTRDPISTPNSTCRKLLSQIMDCLQTRTSLYIQLCEENIYSYETSKYIGCAFYKEVVQQCGNKSYVWNTWRSLTKCVAPTCPGERSYEEEGPAFIPTCSNPNPRLTSQDRTSTCVCPKGTVLNDRADADHCVNASHCPCVFSGKNYFNGDVRKTKCQSCMCDTGRWQCSENYCPARCVVEGQYLTTFDGKQYSIPGKCKYVLSQGLNWTITIEFSEEASLETVVLQLYQETFTFSQSSVRVGEEDIAELYESENALVFWQSSIYVLVQTSFGMKIRVQMSPEIQLYITPATNHADIISGLCGNNNNDTTDDFTSSSGIVENSPQTFALSWSVGTCTPDIPSTCSNRDNEIFADEKCFVLNNPSGVFAKCHGYIATDHYHTACIQRTCNCGSHLQQCLCVALGSYAKACASLGVEIGDWRTATNCTLTCQKNQEFSYNVRRCNHTCRSLSGPDPRCGLDDDPVEGCGCPEGTHLNQGDTCTPKAECVCHHYGSTSPPGHVVIDGRQCLCENGEMHCSEDCGCTNGKVCVHCSETTVNTAQKTCDSLSKPLGIGVTCESGCYCPHGHFEDHRGNCVPLDNCTCMYGGKVFGSGEQVRTNCKTCVCGQGQWHCEDEPCPGTCQVYGNGHYQTFDSKWYRFDGHCQYTLVEDYCGSRNGSFSVRVESVPCCDEALTCSRAITLDLQGKLTLRLSDMKVTRSFQKDWTLQDNSLYTTHTVGLYIIISVPSRGITLIWDKHTRITVELHPGWRNQVCGLCGNFDSNAMNDLQISGSAVATSPLDFGNSWKAATPPCSDVTTEIFPCERNSYCSAWAQQRCMIITGDTFKDCHLRVDPEPFYQACVQESCSCQFEGKFLGFCTAVAAYAEACSALDVCVRWRTPDLCPVYCDYYNEKSECTWHYEACGEMRTCNKDSHFTHKLEGCYPRCPKDAPYYDESTGKCTKQNECTCYFNETIVQPGAVDSNNCTCENGTLKCPPPPPPPPPPSTTSTSAGTVITVPSTTSTTVTSVSPSTKTSSTIPSTIFTTTTTTTTTLPTSLPSSIHTQSTTPTVTSAEVYITTAFTSSSSTTSSTTPTSTVSPTTETASSTTANVTAEATSIPTVETWSTTSITSVSSTSVGSSPEFTTIPTTTTTTMSTTTLGTSSTTEEWTTEFTTIPTTTTATTTSTTLGVSSTTEEWTTENSTIPTMTTATTTSTTTLSVSSTTEEASTEFTTIPTTTTATTTSTTLGVSSTTEEWTTENSTIPTTTTATTTSTTTLGVSSTTEEWTTENSTIPTMTTATTTSTTTLSVSSTTEEASTEFTTIPTTTTATTTSTTLGVSSTTEEWTTENSTIPTTTTATTTSTTLGVSSTTEEWTTENSTIPTTTTATTTSTTTLGVSSTTEEWTTENSTIPTMTTATTTSTTTLGVSSTTEETSTEFTTIPTTTTATTTSITTLGVSSTTEERSTEFTTIPTTTITTTLTSVDIESPTAVYNTTAVTISTPTTTSTTTKGYTRPTEPTTETNTTPLTPEGTSTEPTTTSTLESSTSLATNATPAQTPGPTETLTSTSTTTQPTTTSTESTTFTSTTSATVFTSSTSTAELTTSKESTTPMTSTSTGKTQQTSEATAIVTTTSTESTTTIIETGPPIFHTTLQKECSECTDLKTKKTWNCDETWTEDCYHKTCRNGTIELNPVICPKTPAPKCPRGLSTTVSDGCCETLKCDCRCELYGDPHYISFQGVAFDFLDDCTYTLVEEQSPHHDLTIAVDNYYCVPGLDGSCAKGIIVKYRGNTATLGIIPDMYVVQATLNNMTIQPPYEALGFKFETTGYVMSISILDLRSYVSLSPSYTLVVNLAMEHFVNNTQGQCGVCGGGSCIRKGGLIEDDDCCDKTAHDWVYSDPMKPACVPAPRNVSCNYVPPPVTTSTSSPPCPVNPLCELLNHPVFSECAGHEDLNRKKKNCEFDSCTNFKSACSALEQAAEECKNSGICIDWRSLTNGSCDVPCPAGLVYRECNNRLDDFCYGGARFPGASLENNSTGCFCPNGQFRAGNHSSTCVSDCLYCKGPFGEPKLPGDVWQSNCKLCTCNNQTRTEECFMKPPEPAPICSPGAVLVNTSCCGDQACVEKTCTYNDKTYRVGDKWKDDAQPCMSFICSVEGIQTETKVCPREDCPEDDRVWDDKHCCFTCNQSCAPRMSKFSLTIDNCTTVVQMPACQGHCVAQQRVVLSSDLQVEQRSRCCQEQSFERRLMAVHCSDLNTRFYHYKHITSCECRTCSLLR